MLTVLRYSFVRELGKEESKAMKHIDVSKGLEAKYQ